jgi:hypothetical protein
MKIFARIPAREAYAAKDAPALPEESSMASMTPAAARAEISTAVPRSLNDPVGFRYSHLK